MLYTNKRLTNTKRYKEYQELIQHSYQTSLLKENKQQEFLSRVDFVNMQTGEVYQISHSFEKYYKKYTKSIEQKVYAVERYAKQMGLQAIFMTLTLPSKYHPFLGKNTNGKRQYYKLNPNFAFKDFESAIKEGYHYLNKAYRTLYKRAKNKISNLLYIKVFEAHKTLIPHLHVLFFIPSAENEILEKEFAKIVKEFKLNQTDLTLIENDEQKEEKNSYNSKVSKASLYLMKYVAKNLKDSSELFFTRVLDGWKRLHKIRVISTSNLPLTLGDFRTIYHGLEKEQKELLIKEAKQKGINLFYLISVGLTKLINENIQENLEEYKSRFVISKEVVRQRNLGGGYSYKVDNFSFFIDSVQVYKKQKIIKILRS